MLRCLSVGLAAAFLGGAFAPDTRPARAPIPDEPATSVRASLRGVWRVTEVSSRAPGAAWVSVTPNVSLYIFTDRHYSYMFATGAGPRRPFPGDPNKPTDADKVRAYDSFVAASGTYLLSGQTLTLNAILHKNPNEMAGESLTYTVDIEPNTLRMTIVNPPFAPGRERRTVLTRAE
jgi:hypothetical protein